MKYFFTPQRLDVLMQMIAQAAKSANHAAMEGYKSGAEQDGHHDEGYQLSLRETAVQDKRLQNLQEILRNTEIVTPVEQNDTVEITTGVVIAYPDGRRLRCIIEGYVLESLKGERISAQSPLGRAIIGARCGEKRKVRVGDKVIEVLIEKILPPSQAEDVYIEPED